jgi:hypothetical protein
MIENRSIVITFVAVTSLLLLAGCSASPQSDQSGSQNQDESAATLEAQELDAFACVGIVNVDNQILLNQPSFIGDVRPDEVMVISQFRLTNNCSKDIDGVKAKVDFQNVVGDTIFRGEFVVDETIPVGSSITTSDDEGFFFNKFEDEHGVLSTLNEDKTRSELKITRLVYSDGTIVEE